MKKFVVSGIQIAIRPNAIRENTEKCCDWIAQACKRDKPKLVVLPESITTGFTPGMPVAEFFDKIDTLKSASVKKIGRVAKQFGVWIVFPMYEKGRTRPVVYNSALLINPQGTVAGVYRKTHPFPTERLGANGWTTPGKKLPVFDLGFAKIGMTICYEGDFPELSRILAIKGAEVIIRPAALLRSFEIWDLTNRARAYDNHVYMVGVNAVGADAGENYYFGHSMIVDPIAHKLAQARGTEEIISAELDPQPLKHVTYGAKSPMIFDHLEDRNVDLYKEILTKAKSSFEPTKRGIRY